MREPLPIDPLLPDLAAALRQARAAVLQAPPGAGKTTRVPPALLDHGLADNGRVLVLEPRRLAARAAARRIAWERGTPPGTEVGFHVRFERQAGPDTRLLVVTPGVFLRLLLDDPYLETTAAVVFDEFHERSLDTDLALGLARLLQQTVRPDLHLVAMSATLDSGPVAAYLGHCPVLVSEGRSHPVEVRYRPRPDHQPLADAVARAAEALLDEVPGDLLVFLPGLAEIRQTSRRLEDAAARHGAVLVPLYGDLPSSQQDAALLPGPCRKVVLATNVAETSVTVEGVRAVLDTGLARQLHYDPAVGLDRLVLAKISRAAADQRAGRAGRTGPGVCVRLWSEPSHRARPAQTEPEVRRVDVAGAVLQLLALGERDVARFPWIEPPREAAVAGALTLLERLGALRAGVLTGLGRDLARLPVPPRLGRLLIEGQRLGQPARAALAAALLAERDPFPRSPDGSPADRGPGRPPSPSDVLDRVEALEAYESRGTTSFPLGELARGPARFILQARDQLARLVRLVRHSRAPRGSSPRDPMPPDEAVLRALLAAYPDRLTRRREPGSRKGVMLGGRGVVLARTSAVLEPELFLSIDVDAAAGESLVRLASEVRRDWLSPALLRTAVEVSFDAAGGKVVARRVTRVADLVLDDRPAALPDEAEVARVLAAAAGDHLPEVLPALDTPAGQLLTRLRCLASWMPELGLPACDAAALGGLLPDLCRGRRSLADLRTADWSGTLLSRLTFAQRQALDREAPERLPVPSGRHIALRYEEGRPPVLAVRIQELFGLARTPRVAAGRVTVLLHLLAPNGRPQQVTDDLESFWANTYAVVRKELRARYPRHAWPEDPGRRLLTTKDTKDTKKEEKKK